MRYLGDWWCYLFHVFRHDVGEWFPVDFADFVRTVRCKRCGRCWMESR
jgi:hypothetical protein